MLRLFPKSATAILVTGMQSALGSLQAARAELVRAEANKGGHRDRAIGFVDSAIAETKAGIAYAR